MKEKYYHLRDKERRPIVTVCLLVSDKAVFARGVSLCSLKDNPCKKDGRERARERAYQALHNGNDEPVVRGKAYAVLFEAYRGSKTSPYALKIGETFHVFGHFPYKCQAYPAITEFEDRILFGPRGEMKH